MWIYILAFWQETVSNRSWKYSFFPKNPIDGNPEYKLWINLAVNDNLFENYSFIHFSLSVWRTGLKGLDNCSQSKWMNYCDLFQSYLSIKHSTHDFSLKGFFTESSFCRCSQQKYRHSSQGCLEAVLYGKNLLHWQNSVHLGILVSANLALPLKPELFGFLDFGFLFL